MKIIFNKHLKYFFILSIAYLFLTNLLPGQAEAIDGSSILFSRSDTNRECTKGDCLAQFNNSGSGDAIARNGSYKPEVRAECFFLQNYTYGDCIVTDPNTGEQKVITVKPIDSAPTAPSQNPPGTRCVNGSTPSGGDCPDPKNPPYVDPCKSMGPSKKIFSLIPVAHAVSGDDPPCGNNKPPVPPKNVFGNLELTDPTPQPPAEIEPGKEGGECANNYWCESGLSCQDNVCRQPEVPAQPVEPIETVDPEQPQDPQPPSDPCSYYPSGEVVCPPPEGYVPPEPEEPQQPEPTPDPGPQCGYQHELGEDPCNPYPEPNDPPPSSGGPPDDGCTYWESGVVECPPPEGYVPPVEEETQEEEDPPDNPPPPAGPDCENDPYLEICQ